LKIFSFSPFTPSTFCLKISKNPKAARDQTKSLFNSFLFLLVAYPLFQGLYDCTANLGYWGRGAGLSLSLWVPPFYDMKWTSPVGLIDDDIGWDDNSGFDKARIASEEPF